ncbi:MAG: carcinine hydrolase/isopenicillin-N N-acyltransferase family protein [Clostridia bacterium]
MYCNEEEHGCTVFAVKSKDKVYLARNMDMFPEYKKTSESVLYRVEGKNTFLAHSTAMISLEDGINEHGLSIALTFLLSKKIKPGYNNKEDNWYYTNDRYNTIDNYLKNNATIDFDKCKELISGKYGFIFLQRLIFVIILAIIAFVLFKILGLDRV